MTDADPLPLAQSLIRCASVTPADAGAQNVLAAFLEPLGFAVTRLRFGAIENLFARIGSDGPHFCFAGHTDVVPAGAAGWRTEPFAGEVREDFGESLAFVEWAGAAVGSFGGIEMIFRVEKVGVGESAEEEARAKGRTKIVGFLPRGKIWKLDAIGVHASQQSG